MLKKIKGFLYSHSSLFVTCSYTLLLSHVIHLYSSFFSSFLLFQLQSFVFCFTCNLNEKGNRGRRGKKGYRGEPGIPGLDGINAINPECNQLVTLLLLVHSLWLCEDDHIFQLIFVI